MHRDFLQLLPPPYCRPVLPGLHMTRRWREKDSNPRSLLGNPHLMGCSRPGGSALASSLSPQKDQSSDQAKSTSPGMKNAPPPDRAARFGRGGVCRRVLGLTRFGGHPESLARGAADAKNTSTIFA
jgi:hypothetical protein